MFLASKLFYLANIGMKPPDPHCYFELDSTSLFSPTKSCLLSDYYYSLSEMSRHISVLAETIKKGIHDADSEARIEARK